MFHIAGGILLAVFCMLCISMCAGACMGLS
jgi:hypothetical protein